MKDFKPFDQAPRFKIGDIVYLKSGHAPQVVLEICSGPKEKTITGYMIRCAYIRNYNESETWRTEADYLLYEGNPNLHDYTNKTPHRSIQKDKPTMTKKLYQTLEETPRFGFFLAQNSTGQFVLEMEGSASIQAFRPDEVEEVKPYTVTMSTFSGRFTVTTTKGKVQQGDVILMKDGQIAVVVKLDTGFQGPCPTLEGRRLVTEEL